MKAQRIIECVPNFSEGRDEVLIHELSACISGVQGVKLLHVDMGKSTHRTVVTFAGDPDAVVEAAFRAIAFAASRIDMRKHKGEHPRMGATDVCPLIPVQGISLEETVKYSRKLAKRVGDELGIPVYLYEASASEAHRKNLADIRQGEYEGYFEKIKQPEWKPDFGPGEFNERSGATVIGARDFLIAYNVNLNTKSVRLANELAFDIRENGRPLRDPVTGLLLKDEQGVVQRSIGQCPGVKAIGWYIDEYQFAQVSMNLTSMQKTSLHEAFEACRTTAERYGLIVTGSELVGLIPRKAMTDAGNYFLKKQKRSLGVSEQELIEVAIQSLGLNSIQTFDPKTRIIEYMLEEKSAPLVGMTLEKFSQETASENPAPGGGSVAAYVGVLGASLGAMVANLSAHKKGYEDQYEFFSTYAREAQEKIKTLLDLVDEDTKAFNGIIEAVRLPKSNPEEKKLRKKAMRLANIRAIDVPLETMKAAASCLNLIRQMVEKGNPNSISDAGVGALCIRTAVEGAGLNVRINAINLEDDEKKAAYLKSAEEIETQVKKETDNIISYIREKMSI